VLDKREMWGGDYPSGKKQKKNPEAREKIFFCSHRPQSHVFSMAASEAPTPRGRFFNRKSYLVVEKSGAFICKVKTASEE